MKKVRKIKPFAQLGRWASIWTRGRTDTALLITRHVVSESGHNTVFARL